MKRLLLLFSLFWLASASAHAQASCPIVLGAPTIIPLSNPHWYKFSITYENPTNGKKSIKVHGDCVTDCIEVSGNQGTPITYVSDPFYSADPPVITWTSYPGRFCNGNPCNQQSLPVYFTSITARREGHAVHIAWSASIENMPSAAFSVERSTDGSSYQRIATVQGTPDTENYSYTDVPSHMSGDMAFYRIHADGKYSTVASVTLSKEIGFALTCQTLTLYNLPEGSVARMINMIGQEVLETDDDITPVSAVSKGLYVLSVMDKKGNVLYNRKVFKE